MACGANSSCIAVVGREPGMVEGRPCPRGGGVAGLAGRRETGCRVIGIGSGLVIGLMTREAIGRNRSVVVVHVATGAGDRRVLAGQGECSVAVVERRRNPGRGVVTHFTLLRESRLDVIRAGGAVEILHMAGSTGGAVQAVVAIYVALRTLQRDVCPGQRETRSRVIESCVCPGHGRMTGVASLRESSLSVVRIRRALIVLQVAGGARTAAQRIISIDVTLGTLERKVCSRQCESGSRMVKARVSP